MSHTIFDKSPNAGFGRNRNTRGGGLFFLSKYVFPPDLIRWILAAPNPGLNHIFVFTWKKTKKKHIHHLFDHYSLCRYKDRNKSNTINSAKPCKMGGVWYYHSILSCKNKWGLHSFLRIRCCFYSYSYSFNQILIPWYWKLFIIALSCS